MGVVYGIITTYFWFTTVFNFSRDILGMVTLGHMMAMMMRNKVKATDPVSNALFKQFKSVSIFS